MLNLMLRLNPLKKDVSLGSAAGRNLERADAIATDEISEYAAQFYGTLKGVGAQEKSEICREIEQHLRASAAAFSGMSISNDVAQREAIARFGALQTHGVKVRRELHRRARQTDERAATWFALRVYAGAVLMLLLLAMPFWIYSLLHTYWVLPTSVLVCLGLLNIICLFFAGWIVGRETRRAAKGASLRALPIVVIVLLFLGVSLKAISGFAYEHMFHDGGINIPGYYDIYNYNPLDYSSYWSMLSSDSVGSYPIYSAYHDTPPRSIMNLLINMGIKASTTLEVHAFHLVTSLPLILIGLWLGCGAMIGTRNLAHKAR